MNSNFEPKPVLPQNSNFEPKPVLPQNSNFQPKSILPQNNSTLGQMDKDLLECGKFGSIIKIIAIVFITIIMIIFSGLGYYIYNLPITPINSAETTATIVAVSCSQKPECSLNVSYKVDGKDYISTVSTSEISHKKDDIIKINYDKTNPVTTSYNQSLNNKGVIISISIASFLILLIIIHFILLKVSKKYERLMCFEK
jgi:hypothetical protein